MLMALFGLFNRKTDREIVPFKRQKSFKDIVNDMRGIIIRADWRDEYQPDEGETGVTAPDKITELNGFKNDARHHIIGKFEAIERRLAQDVLMDAPSHDEICKMLTDLAYEQNRSSAGPFLRSIAIEMRDTMFPDYIENLLRRSFVDADGQEIKAAATKTRDLESAGQRPLANPTSLFRNH
ncbi:MAG: hypothetical protein CMH28_10100 [Micavibrio sp.]|nr:hypothetical protein [Micavibrio sp.]